MTVSFPSSRIVPLSGWWMPARILTRVLLPAPFSPTRAWISPGSSSSETSSSACVARNRLEIPLSSTRAGAPGVPGGGAAGAMPTVMPAPSRRSREPCAVATRTVIPRAVTASIIDAGAASSVSTSSIWSVWQNVANAARSHLVWSTIAMTSRAAATIARLIWASSSVASLRPDSRVNPAAPTIAFWTLIRSKRPSPSWPTTERASQRTRPPSIRTMIPGEPASSEAIRSPLVMTVSWLQPPCARSRRATASAVVLASMTMLSPSRTRDAARVADRRLLLLLEPLAQVEGELGMVALRHDRATVRADHRARPPRARRGPCGWSPTRPRIVRRGRSRGRVRAPRRCARSGPGARGRRHPHGRCPSARACLSKWPIRGRHVSKTASAHLRANENVMSRKQVEIIRNLCHAVVRWPGIGHDQAPGWPSATRSIRSAGATGTPPPPVGPPAPAGGNPWFQKPYHPPGTRRTAGTIRGDGGHQP